MLSLLAISLAWKITNLTRSRYLKQKYCEANVTAKTRLKLNIANWLQVEDLYDRMNLK